MRSSTRKPGPTLDVFSVPEEEKDEVTEGYSD
jgi:hypothetical protein